MPEYVKSHSLHTLPNFNNSVVNLLIIYEWVNIVLFTEKKILITTDKNIYNNFVYIIKVDTLMFFLIFFYMQNL